MSKQYLIPIEMYKAAAVLIAEYEAGSRELNEGFGLCREFKYRFGVVESYIIIGTNYPHTMYWHHEGEKEDGVFNLARYELLKTIRSDYEAPTQEN